MDGIEKDLQDRADVVRLNLMSDVGRAVATRYGVRSIPTLLVLDGTGTERYRHTGMPDRREVVAQVVAR